MRHHKELHEFLLLGAALVMMPFGCSDPAVPADAESEADSPGGFKPTPQVGDSCEFGDGPCCWTRDYTRTPIGSNRQQLRVNGDLIDA